MQRAIRDILLQDAARLDTTLDLGATTARIEAQCLLQHVLKVPRSYLLAHAEQVPNPIQQSAYDALLQRRLLGEPVAHITGAREFFGLTFNVSPDTLIPRPETELLVELALQRIPPHGPFRVLDLGTGSGAIAISMAQHRPDAEVVAVDASEAALRVARENATHLGIANVNMLFSNWFSALSGQRYNLIVSNPPYIATGDIHLTQGDVRFEPLSALASGPDGLDDIRHIIMRAGDFLEHGAWLLIEHGYDQADDVRSLFQQNGFAEVFSERDISGIERVTGGRSRK
jgi:release factor glutamine methyltransferase